MIRSSRVKSCPVNAPLPPLLLLGLDQLNFENSFAQLPPAFHTRLAPTPLPDPYLVHVNAEAAALIGLDPEHLSSEELALALAGNRPLRGADPVAAVYSGHQFGVWAGQLGDGRAILLGEVRHADARWELQLKGSGLTPYSRRGDGRAVLRSSIREYLCAEAMHHLGIPTTRSLAIVGSDLAVIRENVESAAVVTRMAATFVRFGSFEHWFHRDRPAELRILADYVIDGYFPECRGQPNPYRAMLGEIVRRTARMVAQWQAVGFCHGVMNTDNMSILGLTLDYGPFGFMEGFDAGHVCNHSDDQGRYSYEMQPAVAHWNLYCLGQSLLPLIGSVEEAQSELEGFGPEFSGTLDRLLHRKLGLRGALPSDEALIDSMFALLQSNRVDFTSFFRRLSGLGQGDETGDAAVRDLFIDRPAFDVWSLQYRTRLGQENLPGAERAAAMDAVNPKFVLRNWMAEQAIRQASEQRDFSELDRLMAILRQPFAEQPEHERYASPPPDWANGLEVSCSS